MNKLQRIVECSPAYDKRNPNPNINYGIHGVEIRFVLKGERGAVQFLLFTNWQLPYVTEEFRPKLSPDNYFLFEPMPADLGYHSLAPQWEGQKRISEHCEYLDGRPCYYDGSGLNAEPIYTILLEKGSDGVWAELEKYYKETFGEE